MILLKRHNSPNINRNANIVVDIGLHKFGEFTHLLIGCLYSPSTTTCELIFDDM